MKTAWNFTFMYTNTHSWGLYFMFLKSPPEKKSPPLYTFCRIMKVWDFVRLAISPGGNQNKECSGKAALDHSQLQGGTFRKRNYHSKVYPDQDSCRYLDPRPWKALVVITRALNWTQKLISNQWSVICMLCLAPGCNWDEAFYTTEVSESSSRADYVEHIKTV